MEKNKTIMVIDDDLMMLKLIMKKIMSFGYRCEGYILPTIALNKYRLNPNKYDLIITDYIMPELNGLLLIKEVYSINNLASIMLYSTFISKELEVKAFELGACSFVPKPLDWHRLEVEINNILNMELMDYSFKNQEENVQYFA